MPWQTAYGGGGIPVAILDTGVYNHLDLEVNIAQCNDFTAQENPTVVGSCKDDNGHGTHVAGTVLANGGIDGKNTLYAQFDFTPLEKPENFMQLFRK